MLNTIKYFDFKSLGGKQGHEKIDLQEKESLSFFYGNLLIRTYIQSVRDLDTSPFSH